MQCQLINPVISLTALSSTNYTAAHLNGRDSDKKTSMWLGALFSIAYMTDIEIEDGFATNWGFSPGDELCNTLGAFYPVLQNYVKPLEEFNFKWSYFPSEEIREGTKNGAFLDDYNGQTMWLSIGVHHFLPKAAKKYWPIFLILRLVTE